MTNGSLPSNDGILVVDKPTGPTSAAIVRNAKAAIGKKVGHTGTLDPLATGVLVLVIGRATRLSKFFQNLDKHYRAIIQLGQTTSTCDAEGTVLSEAPVGPLIPEQLDQALEKFRGQITQIPPMFSALKVGGQRLYHLARRGERIKRDPRTVQVYELDLLKIEGDRLMMEVRCSSGTYIRALARDVGEALGCGAFLASLRRLSVGSFGLSESLPADRIETDWATALLPMDTLLTELPTLQLSESDANRIVHGNFIQVPEVPETEKTYRLIHKGSLIGVGKFQDGEVRPSVVLTHTLA